MENYRVVCVNNKKRPASIPLPSWLEEGEVYTVEKAMNMSKQRMALGYILVEVKLPEDSEYECYMASRFRPYTDADAEAEEAVEELLMEELMTIEL